MASYTLAIIGEMRVVAGQEWELPSAGHHDPLILRIVEEVDDRRVAVHTLQRSAPNVVLDRSTMWKRDVIDAGVLVAGPGALDARRREARSAHLRDLILYAARRSKAPVVDGNVRFDAHELIQLVVADEKVPRDDARAMLRDVLGQLGGVETTAPSNWYWDHDHEVYVIPAAALAQAA
jgi:hypothetical protein